MMIAEFVVTKVQRDAHKVDGVTPSTRICESVFFERVDGHPNHRSPSEFATRDERTISGLGSDPGPLSPARIGQRYGLVLLPPAVPLQNDTESKPVTVRFTDPPVEMRTTGVSVEQWKKQQDEELERQTRLYHQFQALDGVTAALAALDVRVATLETAAKIVARETTDLLRRVDELERWKEGRSTVMAPGAGFSEIIGVDT